MSGGNPFYRIFGIRPKQGYNPDYENFAENMLELEELWRERARLENMKQSIDCRLTAIKEREKVIQDCPLGDRA